MTRLRNEIFDFTQKGNGSSSEVWEQFKGYTWQCPHHGFSKELLLSTLYCGVLPNIMMLFDTVGNSNFLGQQADQGMVLIKNFAMKDENYGEDYGR